MFDVIIIGGGPAGLSAAIMLGRACRRVLLVDAGEQRNSAARELHGFLGRDGSDPQALLRDGRSEAAKYAVETLEDTVTAAKPLANPQFKTAFQITTVGGCTFEGRKLLFATGVRDLLAEIPGIRECYGTTVHHCPYCDAWEHRGKHLLAWGHTATAGVGLGISLRGWSSRITVLTNGQTPTENDRKRVQNNAISFCELPVLHVDHANGHLQKVICANGVELIADALFFNFGQRAGCELPATLGCKIDNAKRGQTGHRQCTNSPGVFLAGDADGDVQFVIVAAGEGATPAVTINRELQDEDAENGSRSAT